MKVKTAEVDVKLISLARQLRKQLTKKEILRLIHYLTRDVA